MDNKKLSHSEFKNLARRHQIIYKTTSTEEGGLGIERSPSVLSIEKIKRGK